MAVVFANPGIEQVLTGVTVVAVALAANWSDLKPFLITSSERLRLGAGSARLKLPWL
jgi:hypothetical protein